MMHQMNPWVQEQNMHLSMVNCMDDELMARYNALSSRLLVIAMMERQVCKAEVKLCKFNS